MLEDFLAFVNDNQLLDPQLEGLLAVSGGVDSMVMLHLFHKANFRVSIAHANFQLRGKDSDTDEQLISKQAEFYGLDCYIKSFDTKSYAENAGISIQMAARELRYQWFNELMALHNFHYVATAHHLNDSIETILLNLIKGTGLSGLSGILVKQDSLVRPLMFATRNQIEGYAFDNAIEWREDASNTKDEYQRNYIRHHIVPLFHEINPSFDASLKPTIDRLRGSRFFFEKYVEEVRTKAFQTDGEYIYVQRSLFEGVPSGALLVWELVKKFGFNYKQCEEVVSHHHSGSKFLSQTHQLLVDRDNYIISKLSQSEVMPKLVSDCSQETRLMDFVLTLRIADASNYQLSSSNGIAQLDMDKISFPLVWRLWEHGDKFVPLGMHHSKKISDFLIDNKVPLVQKEKTTVLVSDGHIVWVVGSRIADPYKVTANTSRILIAQIQKV